MKCIIIAAISSNHIIGNGEDLVWHLPNDLAFYHQQVMHQYVLMGRKTFETEYGILPVKETLVLTRNKAYNTDGTAIPVSTLQAAKNYVASKGGKQLFILGGGEVYKLLLEHTDEMIITEVKVHINGSTLFPMIDSNIWQETKRIHHFADAANAYDHDFVWYSKK